ncbi:hypothetical protein [Robertkochia flava]|uniref:hypothetical protein n=1 Tax=Robertkochia flava TaxID=3447986 RepID=UPI001CCA7F81|nr:hypothetical protein [Robertkochia marina]
MKRPQFFLIVLVLIGIFQNHAQEKDVPRESQDLQKLTHLFTRGKLEGHIRNYFMLTHNQGNLKDYYTDAVGGSIAFRTMPINGFEAGVKGLFTYSAFSADLNAPDPITGGTAKWEHQLYDITNPYNLNDLDRLEHLYLKYRFSSGYVTYGKMEIEDTPLLNESDDRMKPFAFKGVWMHLDQRGHTLDLSWIDRVSPRSTVEWFDFNEAIGIEDNGYQPNGTPAHYHERTESRGIALLNYEYRYDHWRFRYNHWYLHRISNTGMLHLEYDIPGWRFGMQYALQTPDHFQAALPYAERYMQEGEQGQVFSSMAEFRRSGWMVNASFSKAFASGRFLFPRELGRDHFYTSVQRSRLDGFGDAAVFTLRGGWDLHQKGMFLLTQFTGVYGPEVGDYRFNKYNLDSYYLWNTKFTWHLHNFFEGLNLELLYVRKWNRNNSTPEVVFNSSNLGQLNFIVNYEF